MLSGIVRSYDRGRGYGHIAPDRGGADVFVHKLELRQSGLEELKAGDAVWFAVRSDGFKFRATTISILSAPAR